MSSPSRKWERRVRPRFLSSCCLYVWCKSRELRSNVTSPLETNDIRATELYFLPYSRVAIILFSTEYVRLHFLPILSVFCSLFFIFLWFYIFLVFSFSVLCFGFIVISKDVITFLQSESINNHVLSNLVLPLYKRFGKKCRNCVLKTCFQRVYKEKCPYKEKCYL